MLSRVWLLALVICCLGSCIFAQNDPASAAPGQDSQSPATDQKPVNDAPPTAYRVGGGVSAPKLTYEPDPKYSEKARKARYQGTVVLWLIVDTNGLPQSIRVQRSLGMGLDEEAVKAVKRWRFEPAKREGQPVPVMINVEVNFRLYDSLSPHPESARQPPRFPGVNTAEYPLTVRVSPVSFAGSGSGATASHKAVITDAGQQQELTISCVVASPNCLTLDEGTYPARWLEKMKTLEILGLTSGKHKNWTQVEYTVVAP
jgi:TonB family protein